MRAVATMLAGVLVGCAPKNAEPEPAPVEITPAADASTKTAEAPAAPSILLDGAAVTVAWDDGDTFVIVGADGASGDRARLAGFNTLESYGPVHRWGSWTPQELHVLSKEGGDFASAQVWTCTREEGSGGYGRAKVDCPDLRRGLLTAGLAHLFGFDDAPSAEDLAAQQAAMTAGAGMWAKGAPAAVVTSLHSLDEKDGQTSTYNRVADTATGMARKVDHAETYAVCQEVCVDDACMIYVPYTQRYGDDRAACLRDAP